MEIKVGDIKWFWFNTNEPQKVEIVDISNMDKPPSEIWGKDQRIATLLDLNTGRQFSWGLPSTQFFDDIESCVKNKYEEINNPMNHLGDTVTKVNNYRINVERMQKAYNRYKKLKELTS